MLCAFVLSAATWAPGPVVHRATWPPGPVVHRADVRRTSGAMLLTRRSTLAAAAVSFTAPVLAKGPPNPALTDDVKLLISKARGLRAAARGGAERRRLLPIDPTSGVNNYGALTRDLRAAVKKVLLPLVAELAAAAERAAAAGLLAEDRQKELARQPQLLRGHVLELEAALSAHDFEPVRSSSSGTLYPGGRVERELEEVGETCDAFVALAEGRA